MTRRLFISYSHRDTAHLGELRTHLKPLERKGIIKPWFDGYLLAGDDIDQKVRDALEQADLIALIVSPDFLASDYCYDVEMQDAVARHKAGTARVVPIIVRRSQWHDTPFGRLRATPTDGAPIVTWADRDEAWTIVAKDIAEAAQRQPATLRQRASVEAGALSLPEEPTPARRMSIAVPRKITQKDKDDYRHAVFEDIAHDFEEAVRDLPAPLSGRFVRLDANRFTATLYRDGERVSGCTVWFGGGHFGRDSICYNGDDRGDTNTMTEWLSVESNGGELYLTPAMSAASGRSRRLTPDEASELFWSSFTNRLR